MVILISRRILVIGIVVVGGGTSLHEIGLGEFLSNIFGSNSPAIRIDQTAASLLREHCRRDPGEQNGK